MLELHVHHVHGDDLSAISVLRPVLLPGVHAACIEGGITAPERLIAGRALAIEHGEFKVGVILFVHTHDPSCIKRKRISSVDLDVRVAARTTPHVAVDEGSERSNVLDGVTLLPGS